MRFLLDQGVPRTAADALAEAGHVAEHVGDLGMSRAADDEILAAASARDAVIVTLDGDFHTLLALGRALRPSVIRLRIERLKGPDVARTLGEVLQAAETDLLGGAAVTVTAAGIRVHRLPIGGQESDP